MYTPIQERFHDTLHALVGELEKRSLDYRAIGSVAAEATGVMPINFTPRQAVDEVDKNPDLDILLPRNELAGAREVREMFLRSSYPLKLGLAIPSMQVDLRPDDETSRLTWGRNAMPIESRVFDAQWVGLGDVPLMSVSAETLRHFYSCMSPGGINGAKYVAKLSAFDEALGLDAPHSSEDPYRVFHEYHQLMESYIPMSRRAMALFYGVTAHVTPEQRNHLRHLAFKLAGLAGWR